MSKEWTRKQLADWAERRKGEFESLLEQFVETPSVSSDPDRAGDIRRCADLAASTVRRLGGNAEIIETEGNPIVHAAFDAGKGLPTVAVYNHLDVQPASRETEPWETDPFDMVTKGDTYYGRGATDDKGPALTALFGILAAREAEERVNLRLLWELEEEIGSPNFEEGIRRAKDRIRPDSVVVSDTIWVSRKVPASSAGLRGNIGFELTLETAAHDVHSGTTGGAARNPLGELMKLVSEMYDATTGRVKIKGFYEDVVLASRRELRDYASLGFDVKAFRKAHHLRSLRTDDAIDVMKRIWTMPTMEIHGVVGGYTGPGIKTVIPPSATVKVTCRLVPDQDPDRMVRLVRKFVKQRNPDVKMTVEKSMRPYKAPTEGPLAETVKKAMKFAFGKEPVFVREGGSIGAVATMEEVFRCPITFMGLSLPEHGYHAPNENYDWKQASGGMAMFAKYFALIARNGSGRG
ncbi:MAG TPA: M20/M25/M40 family metallo-hydrolase [Thermoanaerobaculia bacterium]|nr:M20/M25/M40 family metallo-hydrolase [Thermoanaerobaculia bacterium]